MSIDYSKPVQITFADRVSYYGFRCLEFSLWLLPMKFWCLFGRLTGLLAWLILPHYRRLVRRNMRIIFGGAKTTAQLRSLVKDNFQTLICNFIASAKAATMSDKALAKHFTIIGKENVINSLDTNGKGVICAIAHMGNWELLARVRSGFTEVPRFGSMYRELDNPLMETLWQDRRQKSGCEMFGKKTTTLANSSNILRNNGMLGILCDQNAGNYGIIVPYYGKLTSTTNLPALLQRRTKADIIPVTVRTISLGKWEVSFGPALKLRGTGKEIADTTALINEKLAEAGRLSPADGFWLHNRWKQTVLTPREEPIPVLESSYGKATLPLRIVVSMPDHLDEALRFIPVMKAISAHRYDTEWQVICPDNQIPFWEQEPLVSHIVGKSGDLREKISHLNNASPVALDFAFLLDSDSKVYKELNRLSGVAMLSISGEHPKLKTKGRYTVLRPKSAGHRIHDLDKFLHRVQIPQFSENFLPVKRIDAPKGLTLISPFSTLGKEYEWSKSFWSKFNKKWPGSLTILALEQDAERAEQWARDLDLDCIIASIPNILAELRHCKQLIAIDGAIPELAAYVGTPSITLFNLRDPERYCPLGGFHKCIKATSAEYLDDSFVDTFLKDTEH